MNTLPDKSEPGVNDRRRSSLVMSLISLGLGNLVFWPYLYMVAGLYLRRPLPFFGFAFSLSCISGIPLGLAGIILGLLGWVRSPRSKMVVAFAVIGILLSIGGIIGHIWFIFTCQWCQ